MSRWGKELRKDGKLTAKPSNYYPSRVASSKFNMPDNDIAFSLSARYCHGMKLDTPNDHDLKIPSWGLESQEAFEDAINKAARRAFWGNLWPWDKRSKNSIDKKHLRYFIHAHVANGKDCERVLRLEDFVDAARYAEGNRLLDDLFEVHCYIAEDVGIEPANSGLWPGHPEPELDLPSVIDARAREREGSEHRTVFHTRHRPIELEQEAPTASNSTPQPGDRDDSSLAVDTPSSVTDENVPFATAGDEEQEQDEQEQDQDNNNRSLHEGVPDSIADIEDQDPEGPGKAHSSSVDGVVAGSDSFESSKDQPENSTVTDIVENPSNASSQSQQDGDGDTVMSNAGAKAEDEALLEPDIKYYQVGELTLAEAQDEDEIPMTYAVVAEVVRSTPRSIDYHQVPTYIINGVPIGDYENKTEMALHQDLWNRFIANGRCRQPYLDGTLDQDILRVDERAATGTQPPYQLNAPCITTPEDGEFTGTSKPFPPTGSFPRPSNSDIKVVVVIVNHSSRLPAMIWDDNIQGDLGQTDDFAEVYKWAVQVAPVRGGSMGQSLTDALTSVNHIDWDIELWVISQDSERTQWTERSPYQWKAQSGLVARDWLDEKVWKQHKSLYIEVHIVDRPADVSS